VSKQTCKTCARAEWGRTKNGRLHPDGQGRCNWMMPDVKIPHAFYYFGWPGRLPKPSGGRIDRHNPHKDCPTWEGVG
jgi:hypothetical protein